MRKKDFIYDDSKEIEEINNNEEILNDDLKLENDINYHIEENKNIENVNNNKNNSSRKTVIKFSIIFIILCLNIFIMILVSINKSQLIIKNKYYPWLISCFILIFLSLILFFFTIFLYGKNNKIKISYFALSAFVYLSFIISFIIFFSTTKFNFYPPNDVKLEFVSIDKITNSEEKNGKIRLKLNNDGDLNISYIYGLLYFSNKNDSTSYEFWYINNVLEPFDTQLIEFEFIDTDSNIILGTKLDELKIEFEILQMRFNENKESYNYKNNIKVIKDYN